MFIQGVLLISYADKLHSNNKSRIDNNTQHPSFNDLFIVCDHAESIVFDSLLITFFLYNIGFLVIPELQSINVIFHHNL